ncbi:hypothetical protein J5X98_09235 [Leptothermofonsia sichuanensis E412]|uniref:hypothetical protein n=1 Tax=Leptothermofonsia sichuanensis TaxID=2917832 RepID=UPI001CA6C924|nr:hypothetical protein [Leptothermofonsia sichuanensis]QZZ22525.1 hypothetical protein J5X98_09235 [Leptothermofonsia sichuanensis E412]
MDIGSVKTKKNRVKMRKVSVSQLSEVRGYKAQWGAPTLTVPHTLEKGYSLFSGVAEKQDELKGRFKHPALFSFPDSATPAFEKLLKLRTVLHRALDED